MATSDAMRNDGPLDPLEWLDEQLSDWRAAGLERRLRTVERIAPGWIEWAGQRLLDFGSNDYLGLALDPRLVAATVELPQAGAGAAASALVAGHSAACADLEARLAAFEGCEAALVFASGYAANVSTIPALVGRGDAVFSDELNHASLIDGCRLSRADVQVYPHRDVGALAAALQQSRARRKLIVTDGLFSMDGDLAPLVELAALRQQFGAMLLVDEAHATGIFGTQGRGAAEHCGVESQVDIRIGTLSKALGTLGGVVVGRQKLVDWLVQRARGYVFSTALPPSLCRAAMTALDVVHHEPHRRNELLRTAAFVREALHAQGWNLGPTQSQIVPLVVGSAEVALALSSELQRRGLFVPAIRPPSVPEGQARLRISLSWAHDAAAIERLVESCAELQRSQPGQAARGEASRAAAGPVHA
ncbi:MAG: 8-amino-7-oxononanoate synthase [Pirellulales bacterium]|nr:8-amino-7-oxononanoate synthase [Pirellulales bacterium]